MTKPCQQLHEDNILLSSTYQLGRGTLRKYSESPALGCYSPHCRDDVAETVKMGYRSLVWVQPWDTKVLGILQSSTGPRRTRFDCVESWSSFPKCCRYRMRSMDEGRSLAEARPRSSTHTVAFQKMVVAAVVTEGVEWWDWRRFFRRATLKESPEEHIGVLFLTAHKRGVISEMIQISHSFVGKLELNHLGYDEPMREVPQRKCLTQLVINVPLSIDAETLIRRRACHLIAAYCMLNVHGVSSQRTTSKRVDNTRRLPTTSLRPQHADVSNGFSFITNRVIWSQLPRRSFRSETRERTELAS